MKMFLYAISGASALFYASTMLGNSMVEFGTPGSLDLYFISFLLFYSAYFIDKYFFRLFLSISKTRAALGAGIINAVCAVAVSSVFYYFLHLSLQESICFMCIPDVYCLARFQFQSIPFISFAGAWAVIVFLKLFIFMNVFEEKKSWVMPLIILFLARIGLLFCVYYLMKNLYNIIAYLLEYISMPVIMIAIIVTLVLFDYVCSLIFRSNQEEF